MTQIDSGGRARGGKPRRPGRRTRGATSNPRGELGTSASACCTDGCPRPARVCRECVRALAFKWWGAIARHDIGASRCELCEHTGGAMYCADHALDAILDHRAHMRALGHRIGEPPPVDVTDLLSRGQG